MSVKTATSALSLPTLDVTHAPVHVDTTHKQVRASYERFDKAITTFDTTLEHASERCGVSPGRNARRNWLLALATAGSAGAATLGGYEAVQFGVLALGAGTAMGFAGAGGLFAGIAGWVTGGRILRRRAEASPISASSEAKLRAIADEAAADPAVVKALGDRANAWSATLRDKKVHGFSTYNTLEKMHGETEDVPSEDYHRANTWSAVRDATHRVLRNHDYNVPKSIKSLHEALGALSKEERPGIAAAVLLKLFDSEKPRAPLSFEQATKLYADLRCIVDGPALQETSEGVNATAEVVATAQLPAVQTTDVGNIEPLLASTESALREILKDKSMFGGGVVSRSKVERVLANANAPERTAIERAFLGKRLERFCDELDAARLYGYDARLEIRAFAAEALSVDEAERDTAVRLEAYFAATAPAGTATLNEEQVQRIIASVEALPLALRKSAAKRGLERYFDGETPRGKTPFEAATTLGQRLAVHV